MSRNLVVTGASCAIGEAVCRKVVRPGDRVLLHCCRNEDRCRRLAGSLDADCTVAVADFGDPGALAALCGRLGDAEILVHCAAVTRTGLLAHLDDDDLRAMVSANIHALVRICRAVVPGMVARRNGRIVNVSSVAAARGMPGQAVYAGTKGFMESFTRSLAAEYGAKGIRANCVAPGAIEAGSLKPLLALAPEEVRGSIALRKLGTPEDVAAMVAFLCSEEASFISGRTFAVDGGFARGV